MEPKIISSQIILQPQQKIPTKVIVGSAQHFKRTPEPGDNYVRPLMVNAWSQTAGDDFSVLHELENMKEHSKREKELLDKIRVLEENLKAHTELLSQIHATSARTSALLRHQQEHPQLEIKPVQIQAIESQSSAHQINQNASQISPMKNHNSPTSSVINMGSTPTESVKYTIIAESSGDVHEPIEIQLAEDDGALNLNSSADSGRLEICLAPEDVEIKSESIPTPTGIIAHNNLTPSAGPTELNFIKRRKLGVYQNESMPDNSNYYFIEQGALTSSNGSVNSNSFVHQQQQLPTKRRSNSLLKTTKRDLNSGTHIQTTSIHSLMPSPANNNIPLSGGIGMEKKIDTDYVMVSIGPNNTRIPAKVYEGMIWNSASIATRKLLMAIFDRKTLATHSMTGKPSPAFKDHGKPLKQMLDPLVIQDIIFAVTRKCNVSEKEVRNAITTKCADENKMMKLQLNKRTPMREINKENIVAGINTVKSEV